MQANRISDVFRGSPRFLRSVHLERDFYDPKALDNFIVTDFTRSCFSRIYSGFRQESKQRAWRVTGDYGSGKSSFALALAHSVSGQNNAPNNLVRNIGIQQPRNAQPKLIPILTTCSRRSLSESILSSLSETLARLYSRAGKVSLREEIESILKKGIEPSEEKIIALIQEVNVKLLRDKKGDGLLLILDELGKFLEYAASNRLSQDIFLLQRLAESASRSADNPLILVCLLHQGFSSYSDLLDLPAQREWEKVAGRFEEIVFNQPAEQIAQIIASALNVKEQLIPKEYQSYLQKSIRKVAGLGWYGSSNIDKLSAFAPRLYPMHPTIMPVLVRILKRFGQNERSLFSFLLSDEPFGLRAFAQSMPMDSNFFRLHNLYDYVRSCFGHRLSILSYRSHWSLIDSLIESFPTNNELNIQVLKTIGILNLLNDSDLMPTHEALQCALSDGFGATPKQVQSSIEELRKRVVYDRGRSRGLCLWPHTSVDLEKAYETASKAIGPVTKVSKFIKNILDPRPLVARRHYIETGNLRYFEILYCLPNELDTILDQASGEADGVIIVPLSESITDRNLALEFSKKIELKARQTCMVAVSQALGSLASMVQEVQRWDWVATNTPELNIDKFAREEVSRQKTAASSQLERCVQTYLGFTQTRGQMMLEWVHQGKSVKIRDGRELLKVISDIFDETFDMAPRIHNELVNRKTLSSAAAAARMRLLELMIANSGVDFLGLDPVKKPPEMSMYLSVLRNTGLHNKKGDGWRISEPHYKVDEKCRVLPTLKRIREIVQAQPDALVNISDLILELRKPPFGVRDGLIPILLTVFAVANEKDVAFYKDGSFLRELNSQELRELTKAPKRFAIQQCKVEGVRAEIFGQLRTIMEVKPTEDREIELLDVVKTLCQFVAHLPEYVRKTKSLSPYAIGVRDTILSAHEPAKLLFTDLPISCGLSPIAADSSNNKAALAFIKILKKALDDLRAAYPELQERMRKHIRQAFELPGEGFEEFKKELSARADNVVLGVTESKLKAFCFRLTDRSLSGNYWLESLGSFLALKPPAKWHDQEEELFVQELSQLAARFKRIESIVFSDGKQKKNETGIRLAITQANGTEHELVVHFSHEEETKLEELQSQFEALLGRDKRLGLAAVSRALWARLEIEGKAI